MVSCWLCLSLLICYVNGDYAHIYAVFIQQLITHIIQINAFFCEVCYLHAVDCMIVNVTGKC